MLLVLVLISFFAVGAIASGICNLLLLHFSHSLGIRNKNDVTIRWSNESKPSLGGISFFLAFIFGSIAFGIVFENENIFRNREFVGLLSAGTLAFVMGLSDDAYNTRPLFKLFIQITCGLILVYTGTIINISGTELAEAPISAWTAGHFINAVVTVLWVVGVMNSLNMLDNMDGITGTTVLFILLSVIAAEILLFDWSLNIWMITLLVQAGALVGFLRYNMNPSKIFMGDAGSQFIGLFAAFFAIRNLFSVSEYTHITPWAGLMITLLAFTPAAADTITVVINRLKKGQSPMVGGKDHTTHYLVYSGLSDRQVWQVFLILSAGSSVATVLAVLMARAGNPWLIAVLCSWFAIVFAYLYRNTILYKR